MGELAEEIERLQEHSNSEHGSGKHEELDVLKKQLREAVEKEKKSQEDVTKLQEQVWQLPALFIPSSPDLSAIQHAAVY